ncbi:SusC/RagA family TonB-linked outer membrane protein [Pedobacter aquatilis]|uniref:SusC/RagA family TonB-linked outer membrane protein n=1 Tax=Pedobacter aquatilis TaxID=351343 RepID=UPI002930B7CF|nr:SusC/RagA family TonB-linked outer membrane protein [Pedobacter aquatilis]
MKLATFLTLITLLRVSATTFGQRISLVKKKITLNEIFFELKKQAGYDVFISDDVLKSDKRIDVSFNQCSIADVFKSIGGGEVDFQINDNLIIVKRKKVSLLSAMSRYLHDFYIDVSGRIVDVEGRPIAGATIKEKTSRRSVITDENGYFVLKNCSTDDYILISHLGYSSKEFRASQNFGKITLEVSTSKLDEVVIRPYGETSKRLSTGNISTITSKQIEDKPISNVLLALQGEVPGISVLQSSGFANSGVKVQIQGVNSMSRGNDPFIVIDGIPYISQLLPSVAGSLLGSSGPGTLNQNTSFISSGNPLSFINPGDIESISILKDADATAIYGSRAANGAILVTTKKGKIGRGEITIDLRQGVGEQANLMKMLNLQEYLKMRRDAYFGTDKSTVNSLDFVNQYDLNGQWDLNKDTNWQKELLGGSANYSNFQGVYSGGTVNDQYRLSGTYQKETTIFKHLPHLGNEKGSLQLSVNHIDNAQKFKLNFNASYMADVNILPTLDPTSAALSLSPNAPTIFNADGTLNWQPSISGLSTWNNPLAQNLYNKNSIITKNLIGGLTLGYLITKGLNISSQFSYGNIQMDELRTFALAGIAPEYRPNETGNSSFSNGNVSSWHIEPKATYQSIIGKAKLDLLLGITFQHRNQNQQVIRGLGYTNDLLLEDLGAAGSLLNQGTIMSKYRYNALFGRLQYNWDDKYLISFNGRRDGSSRFGSNHTFHNFWSSAGSWIFSSEKFVKNLTPIFSFGKLSISYGTTGNDNIGDYQFLNQYSSASNPVNYQNIIGLVPNGLPNPDLQWEETQKLQYALDLGFLDDKLLLNINYFQNRTSNQLLAYALPSIAGFQSYTANLDAVVQNSGFEFATNFKVLNKNNFRWKVGFNASILRNKLLSFPGLSTSSYANTFQEGKSISIGRYYQFAGVNPQNGLYQFLTADGTLTSNPAFPKDLMLYRDYVNIPTFFGGITNTMDFGNLHLNFLFSFTKKTTTNSLLGNRYPGYGLTNQPSYVAGSYWKSVGDRSNLQVLTANFSYPGALIAQIRAYQSDAIISDASYIQLRNISLSYDFSTTFIKKIGLSNFSIFLNAENLFKITGYRGYDPEVSGPSTLAPLRIIAGGLRVKL